MVKCSKIGSRFFVVVEKFLVSLGLFLCRINNSTRNTFCGTWYLPHSHVHNERTVLIIMAGCMAHAQNAYISTSGLKSDVTILFLDPEFP